MSKNNDKNKFVKSNASKMPARSSPSGQLTPPQTNGGNRTPERNLLQRFNGDKTVNGESNDFFNKDRNSKSPSSPPQENDGFTVVKERKKKKSLNSKLDINKEEEEDEKSVKLPKEELDAHSAKSLLTQPWIFRCHEVDNPNWTINDYHQISQINSIVDFFRVFKFFKLIGGLDKRHNFLSRSGIFPNTEDKHNRNGKIWTIKVPTDEPGINYEKIFRDFSAAVLGEYMIPDPMMINCISFVPWSTSNCFIFKIWIADANYDESMSGLKKFIDSYVKKNGIKYNFSLKVSSMDKSPVAKKRK